jgi:hypothetical protein
MESGPHSTFNIPRLPVKTMKDETLTKIPDLKDRLTSVRSYL